MLAVQRKRTSMGRVYESPKGLLSGAEPAGPPLDGRPDLPRERPFNCDRNLASRSITDQRAKKAASSAE
jgi:hypothetical protein